MSSESRAKTIGRSNNLSIYTIILDGCSVEIEGCTLICLSKLKGSTRLCITSLDLQHICMLFILTKLYML